MPRRALIGNWFEEEAYERDRKRLMQNRDGTQVESGTAVAHMQAKVQHHNTPCALAEVAADGFLHFYSPIMLQNVSTKGCLSVDLDDRQRTGSGWEVDCSTASATSATLRNCVLLAPAPMPPTDSFPIPPDEDVVHYGQPLYILTMPDLCEDVLSLKSTFKSPSSASKVTGRYQHVFFSPDGGDAGAMWCFDYVDPVFQEDMRDHPVKADDVVLIRHNMTSAPLMSGTETFFNDFGPQNEVGCGRITTYASKRKAGPLVQENFWLLVHQKTSEGEDEGEEEEKAEASPMSAAAKPCAAAGS